jgi:hypothetical protein
MHMRREMAKLQKRMLGDAISAILSERCGVFAMHTSTLRELVLWTSPVESGLALSVGLAIFYAIGVRQHSCIGLLCTLAGLHLASRLVQAKLSGDKKLTGFSITPDAADRLAARVADAVRDCAFTIMSLANVEDQRTTLIWTLVLLATGQALRWLSITFVAFVAFAAVFSLPKLYETRKQQCDALLEQAHAKLEQVRTAAIQQYRKVIASRATSQTCDNIDKKRL